jgi:hypothetical protein
MFRKEKEIVNKKANGKRIHWLLEFSVRFCLK